MEDYRPETRPGQELRFLRRQEKNHLRNIELIKAGHVTASPQIIRDQLVIEEGNLAMVRERIRNYMQVRDEAKKKSRRKKT